MRTGSRAAAGPAPGNAGLLMPVYRNPDFRRLPQRARRDFRGGRARSFFALPGWYDLMARHGVPPATETRLYSDERPGSAAALALQVAPERVASRGGAWPASPMPTASSMASSCAPAADVAEGLGAILGEILGELPRWDVIALDELDPRAIRPITPR